jgi:hypothetical protein
MLCAQGAYLRSASRWTSTTGAPSWLPSTMSETPSAGHMVRVMDWLRKLLSADRDAQIDNAPDSPTLPSANDIRLEADIDDTREPLHRCGWRRQPLAFRLRFFQAVTSRLRSRTNAANTSPVNTA